MKNGWTIALSAFAAVGLHLQSFAQEHRVETIQEAAPADELSDEIADLLSPSGIKVLRGTTRTICEIWLCKELTVRPDFKASAELLYPFKVGQLIGVARFPRKGSDFRDQDIAKGVYTMRYALQPVDGAHVGTSPTRDFLLLINAENDKSAAEVDIESLTDLSAEAAQSSHPAMLCLQPGEAKTEPSIRHDENHDRWIVSVQGSCKAGDAAKKLPVNFVVVGMAEE